MKWLAIAMALVALGVTAEPAKRDPAGLETRFTRFRVPNRGTGWSRNVVGEFDGPHRCLKIVMAHTDSVPEGPGANDNASGVGVLVALARRLATIDPHCDVWLAATGAE